MQNESPPIFSHAEPVLAVADVPETISYWQNVLGFPTKLMWGEPPDWGAVSWQKIFIQFVKNERLAAASKGNSIWIRLQHVESLYHFHQSKNAEIVEPLENKPWGLAQYTIREMNGYFLCFAGVISEREKKIVDFASKYKNYFKSADHKRISRIAIIGRLGFIKE
jgi:uncharacterized glyoxalase superfamily protein PhnB